MLARPAAAETSSTEAAAILAMVATSSRRAARPEGTRHLRAVAVALARRAARRGPEAVDRSRRGGPRRKNMAQLFRLPYPGTMTDIAALLTDPAAWAALITLIVMEV